MSDFTTRAYKYFVDKRYSKEAAAALAANAMHESGGSPTIYEKAPRPGSAAGFGMMQWDPQRKAGLYKFAADNGLDPESEDAQLAYIDHELNTTEKAAGDKLRNASSYQDATNAVLSYLRPQGYSDKDPGSSLGYVARYNNGAQLAGVDPINVPPIGGTQTVGAGAASNPAMATAGGLLNYPTPAAPVDTSKQLAALLAAQEDQKKQQGIDDVVKQGMGLLGQGIGEASRLQAAPAQVHFPQLPMQQQPVFPDFATMLAQQRLMRRMV